MGHEFTNSIVLLLGSFLAGWVDAVVGGGGLVLIPLLMITNPTFSNAQALGVNKVAAIFGTGISAITFSQKIASTRKVIKFIPLALVSTGFGALVALYLNKDVIQPIIIILLVFMRELLL